MPAISRRSNTSRSIIAVVVLAAATVSAACKDSTEPKVMVAATNTTLGVNATVANAVANVPFSFPGQAGVIAPAVAGQNLTLTFAGTATAPTATMAFSTGTGSTGTVTANVTFGSCIFAITASTFPAGHALAQGQTITVNPCNMTVNTVGAVANGVATTRSVALLLGAAASAGQSAVVAVNAGGQLTLNGNSVGTVTLTPITG